MRSARVLLLSLLPAIAGAQQPHDRFIGNWLGALTLPGAKLRIALSVTRDSSGALAAVVTSVDQGNATIPGTLSFSGDTLRVAMPAAGASFSGVVTAKGDSLLGTFTQGASLPLPMERIGAIPRLTRPQDPTPPFPYATEEVTFESAPGVRLAGTVTIPAGAGPFPAVALITGSGPQDRDEALAGHRPFLVLADYLARQGIATLRYDDRGFGKSTGNFANATSTDFADDAEAAVRFLRRHSRVAADRVGLIGHSEGGLIAPLVAARTSDVAFIVMLAGPGIPGDSILILQQRLIARVMGAASEVLDRNEQTGRRLYSAVKAAKDSADLVARLDAAVNDIMSTVPEARRAAAAKELKAASAGMLAPWMRYFLTYDPRPTLQKVRVPVLAMNGTRDLQVPYEENLGAIEAALKAGGNRDYRMAPMGGLNHLFQRAGTGSPAEYGTIAETMSPDALELLVSWIHAHTRR